MRRALLVVGLILLILVIVLIAAPSQTPAKCSTAKQPCLELVSESGKLTGIKFNDFRFGPAGCVYYRMTTKDKFSEYCGGYTMEWIGPGTLPSVGAKV